MNACLNLVKAFLALARKNVPDWLRFLALEASAFLTGIYFWILPFFGLYNFSMLALFYLDPPPQFPDHPALNFCLLGLLLRLFLVWR